MITSLSIAAVIVTYNRKRELHQTIECIFEQHESIHIVVVDNNSEDGTDDLLKTLHLPRLHYLRQTQNLGSAGGFNKGMEYCKDKFDFIWLFNDDSRPAPGSLASLLKAIDELGDAKLGMIKIGMLKDGKSEASYWTGRRVTKFIPRSDRPVRTDLITFDGCLIKTHVVNTIGPCDPDFFMGIYEFDFCLRALDHGFTIYTLPNGLIEDEKKGSAKGTPYWRMYYVTRNHLYLGLKRRSVKTVLQFFTLELKKIFAIIFFQRDKVRKLKYKFLAIYHALFNKMGRQIEPTL
jgi:GT2 family glycosyltransferase